MISVIICSVKPSQVSRLEKNIAETIGHVEYEVIAFDNRNTHYGLCEIYNLCAEKSRYDNLCFAHEDIQFDTIGWGEKIIPKLSETDCGVIGFAGTTARISALCGIGLSRAHWRSNYIQHMNKGGMKSCFKNPDRVEFSPAVSVDGMCLKYGKRSVLMKKLFRISICTISTLQRPFLEQVTSIISAIRLSWSIFPKAIIHKSGSLLQSISTINGGAHYHSMYPGSRV